MKPKHRNERRPIDHYNWHALRFSRPTNETMRYWKRRLHRQRRAVWREIVRRDAG